MGKPVRSWLCPHCKQVNYFEENKKGEYKCFSCKKFFRIDPSFKEAQKVEALASERPNPG